MSLTPSSPIPWTTIKALSFDIYGTLIDWETGISTAARSTALGPYLPTSQKTLLLAIEAHDTAVQRENPRMPQTKIIEEGLRRYAAELAVGLPPETISAACAQYAAQIGAYPAFADTVGAIQRLARRFKLVPLSNVDRASFERSLAGPLQGCVFDAVCTAEEIGSYKPDLRNFEFLIARVAEEDLRVQREELVHVAQSLFHDHGPATQVGLRGVWVDRKGVMGGETQGAQEKYGYQLRVESLAELADVVDEAFRAHEA